MIPNLERQATSLKVQCNHLLGVLEATLGNLLQLRTILNSLPPQSQNPWVLSNTQKSINDIEEGLQQFHTHYKEAGHVQ